ncbi:S-adenosylmethionine decarboxylase [Bradyrhizobium sp. 144]|nr:S-adenosylmethionine decarboxylase [Bradyrhizobium sp. 144]
MTLHTWPERSYAAADVFVCGGGDPATACQFRSMPFTSNGLTVRRFRRGASIKPVEVEGVLKHLESPVLFSTAGHR